MEIEKMKFFEELQFNIDGFRRLILFLVLLFIGYGLFSCETYERVKKSQILHKHIKHEKKKFK